MVCPPLPKSRRSLCPGTDIGVLQGDKKTTSGGANLQKPPQQPDKDQQVCTIGHQSDAVVFIHSGPVGKAVHTTCIHNDTESCSSLRIRCVSSYCSFTLMAVTLVDRRLQEVFVQQLVYWQVFE